MIKRLLISLAVLASAIFTLNSTPTITWEEVNSPHAEVVQSLEMDTQTEITVHNGIIYLWCSRPVTVKLFSILGQLISQETVQPGLHRMRLTSRGIYILRAGTTTRRITI